MKKFNMSSSDWRRFWKKVDLSNNKEHCWEWSGAQTPYGYGRFGLNNELVASHRLMWSQVHQRDIPEGMLICHHCDNPPCVNPRHLFLGDHSDNMMDASKKGRLSYEVSEEQKEHLDRIRKFSMESVKKLSSGQVKDVLERWHDGESARAIAEDFPVNHGTILRIKDGQSYSKLVNGWEDSYRGKLRRVQNFNHHRKFDKSDIFEALDRLADGESYQSIASSLPMSRSTVGKLSREEYYCDWIEEWKDK